MDTFLQAQLGFNSGLQQIGGLTAMMQTISVLGIAEFFLVAIATIYLALNAQAGGRMLVFLLVGAEVNALLKIFFHAPRPYWLSTEVKALSTETSYGLPSGHAQIATNAWLYAAREIKKTWAWVTAVVMILLISFSRLYLGVHFVSDVILGWLFGLLVLGLYIGAEGRALKWLSGLSLWSQVGVAFGGALVFAALGLAVNAAMAASPDPVVWATFSKEARSLDSIIGNAGGLFGAGVGLAMMIRWAKFTPSDAWWQRMVCVLIGIVGVLTLQYGLGAALPKDPEVVGFTLRFGRYALMLWWLTFAAPWVCLKLNLAKPS